MPSSLICFFSEIFPNLFKCTSRSLRLCGSVFVVFIVSDLANAQTLTVPATSSTGAYSISWSSGSTLIKVEEYQGNTFLNSWVLGQTGSMPITKTVSGTYTYYGSVCTTGQSGLTCPTRFSTQNIVVTLNASISACTHSTGNTTSYCYDDIGRVKSVRHPNGVIDTYSYDAADNRTQKTSTY